MFLPGRARPEGTEIANPGSGERAGRADRFAAGRPVRVCDMIRRQIRR